MLIGGVALWSLVHLFPSLLPAQRATLLKRLGEGPYKGMFTLAIVAAILLIVSGWRSVEPANIYTPPLLGSPAVPALVLVSFILFAAASAPGNIKRLLRHPMLTGMIVWGGAHLLANGENRSVVLFGGMSLWALVSIIAINRRDGEWQKPAAVSITKDAMTVVASIALFALVAWLHKWIVGVAAIPGW